MIKDYTYTKILFCKKVFFIQNSSLSLSFFFSFLIYSAIYNTKIVLSEYYILSVFEYSI